MVDMGVRGDDVLGPQLVLGQHFLDTFNLVPRVNNDGLAGLFITDDRTVTGQHAHGKNLVNHPRLSFLSPLTIVLDSTAGCSAGVSPAVARASCPRAGAGRSRPSGRTPALRGRIVD